MIVSACRRQSEKILISSIINFVPKQFDKFDFCPSMGALGGIFVCWSTSYFSAITLEKQYFAMKLLLNSSNNLEAWTLVVVYGPYRQPARDEFVNGLYNLDIGDNDLRMLIGDFNFYRSFETRNKLVGNYTDILIFKSIISHLGLIELPIKGRSYTWSNI